MKRLKELREFQRSGITKILNEATKTLQEEFPDTEVLLALFNLLEVEQRDLHDVNVTVMDALIDFDAVHEEIEAELISVKEYNERIAKTLRRLRARLKGSDTCGSRKV